MLEWREREHEEEDFIVGNDPKIVMALQECGLLKLFNVQGLRAQLALLEHLVQMWDVNEQVFHVGGAYSHFGNQRYLFFDRFVSSWVSSIIIWIEGRR